MIRHLIDLLIGAVVILASAYAIYNPVPALAAEEHVCWALDDAVAAAEDLGGVMLDLIDVNGATVDQLLIAEVDGYVQMWGVFKGCMVSNPVLIDAIRDKGQPA